MSQAINPVGDHHCGPGNTPEARNYHRAAAMTTSSVQWILASASPRRREILRGLGLEFRVRPSTLPEPPSLPGEKPVAYARRAARLKAREIGQHHTCGIVIGADTLVVARGRILGKPRSRSEAACMLRSLSGRWHEVITGICLLDCEDGHEQCTAKVSRVHFRRLSSAEISWYLAKGEYADKAGAYAIQGYASLFVDRIEGCYFNIVGFPVAGFERLCRRMGISVTGAITSKLLENTAPETAQD
jgi:septum formation protein